jgi:uncharacterized membrane protein (UPF0127 family)
MKKFVIILVVIVAGIFIWKYFHPLLNKERGGERFPSSSVTIDGKTFQVALAKTPAEQQKGLGDVTHLEKNSGMLFIFPKLDKYGFWMKDTLIPLDIIWIDTDWKIVFMQKNVTPDSFPTVFTPNTPALYVLELNSGISDEFNFKIGDKVQFSPQK